MKLEFFRQIFEKYSKISNFMKMCPVIIELFRAAGRMDGRTDRQTDWWTDEGKADIANLIVAFRNFALAPIQKIGPSREENEDERTDLK
jgi:hypothetical protein